MDGSSSSNGAGRRRQELVVFIVLAGLLAPILSIAGVGSYGFAVWMYQLVAGPPTAIMTTPVKAPPKTDAIPEAR